MRVFILVALLAACGDNKRPTTNVTPDAGGDASALAPCLERPDQLPTPSSALPCELLPPGFVAP